METQSLLQEILRVMKPGGAIEVRLGVDFRQYALNLFC